MSADLVPLVIFHFQYPIKARTSSYSEVEASGQIVLQSIQRTYIFRTDSAAEKAVLPWSFFPFDRLIFRIIGC